jgi:hypothetical protein
MTAFIWIRPVDMLGPGVHAGDAADRSIVSVELVATGSPPPKFIIFGLYDGGSSGRSTDEPF